MPSTNSKSQGSVLGFARRFIFVHEHLKIKKKTLFPLVNLFVYLFFFFQGAGVNVGFDRLC